MASVSRATVSPWMSWPSMCRRRSCPWFAGGATASLISAVSCSTDVATSRGYALELFGALSLQSLRVAITTVVVVSSTTTLTLYSPRHSTSGVVRIRRDAPARSPRRRPPCCRTIRNRYISSTYSVNPVQSPGAAATRPFPNLFSCGATVVSALASDVALVLGNAGKGGEH